MVGELHHNKTAANVGVEFRLIKIHRLDGALPVVRVVVLSLQINRDTTSNCKSLPPMLLLLRCLAPVSKMTVMRLLTPIARSEARLHKQWPS